MLSLDSWVSIPCFLHSFFKSGIVKLLTDLKSVNSIRTFLLFASDLERKKICDMICTVEEPVIYVFFKRTNPGLPIQIVDYRFDLFRNPCRPLQSPPL